MLIFKKIHDIEGHLKLLRKQGKTVGFVPTMGALHKGHISLLKRSKQQCKISVCSIFVNPTQFNDKADFDKYPVAIDKDIEMLKQAKCDILFLPSVKEMYPNGFAEKKKITFGFIAETLEGEHRPGHFDGVAQIVEKLLRTVKPDKLFMGQKDYQQQLIVKELIKKRRFKTELVTCPTLREKDGLAMSSRNVRLNKEARKLATEISKVLKATKAKIKNQKSKIKEIQEWAFQRLASIKGIEVEYFEIRNADMLQLPKRKNEKLVALVAVKIGSVRLIDNMVV